MKKVLSLLLVLSFFLYSEQAKAQKNYTVAHYTGDNGLPQNSVKSIAADSQGFIWLATEDGLVRYDGQHFYVFNDFNLKVRWNRLSYIIPGLKDNVVGNGRNSVMYGSFYNGEVARIENGNAVLDSAYVKRQNSLLPVIISIGKSYLSSGLPDRIGRMDKSSHYKIMSGANEGDFYICGHQDISYFSNFKKKYTLPFTKDISWDFFTIGGMLFYMYEDATFKSVYNGKITDFLLSGDITRDTNYEKGKRNIKIFWNRVSDQAFLYLDKNLYSLDLDRSKSGEDILETKLLIEDFDLLTTGIEKIHYDKLNQKVFLGSGTDGFFILSKHQFQVLTIKGNYLDNVFYSQIPLGKNAVVTAVGDIVGKEPGTGKMIDKKIPDLNKANLLNKRTLVKDKYGAVWTSNAATLYYMAGLNGKLVERWQFSKTIETVHEGKSDYLWVPEVKAGLYRINLKDAHAKPELYIKNASLEINCLESESADRLLAGTWKGLYTIDISSKKVNIVKGTEGVSIKSVHAFGDGNSWITALGKGVMLLDKKGVLTTFPMDRNRYLANAHCIVDDGKGYFWVPTNNGLFQIAKKDLLNYARLKVIPTELFYLYHAKDEGFNSNEFNGSCVPCGLNLANGYVSLPSMNGFVWFRPEQINNTISEGKIVLDKVLVNQKLLAASNDTLYFPLNPEQVKLNFSTAYFRNPYNLRISYALVKGNTTAKSEDWIPLDDGDFKIAFSNLKSGNYTLIVRKLNGFGINNYTIKKVYFVVPLLWYQTLWADVLMVVLLIAGIYFYNLWRLKKVKFENARLEEVVDRRTKRLNETLTDLEVSKNEMTQQVHMLSRLLTSMTHDIQSPLNFLKLTSGNIPKMIQKGQYEDVAMLGEMISESSRSMSMLLGGLLDYIKAHVYENSLHFEVIDLRMLVDDKFGIFKNMIAENNSHFSNKVPDDIQVYCDYQMLGIMIHNLIDNAAKFTRKGEIRIYFNIIDENEKELVISNTTVGIPKDIQDMINLTEEENVHLPVFPGVSSPAGQGRTSLGLLIVKEIAALVGINLKVTQSDVTCFHLIFKNNNIAV